MKIRMKSSFMYIIYHLQIRPTAWPCTTTCTETPQTPWLSEHKRETTPQLIAGRGLVTMATIGTYCQDSASLWTMRPKYSLVILTYQYRYNNVCWNWYVWKSTCLILQIFIEATTGSSVTGEIAIDYVELWPLACPWLNGEC